MYTVQNMYIRIKTSCIWKLLLESWLCLSTELQLPPTPQLPGPGLPSCACRTEQAACAGAAGQGWWSVGHKGVATNLCSRKIRAACPLHSMGHCRGWSTAIPLCSITWEVWFVLGAAGHPSCLSLWKRMTLSYGEMFWVDGRSVQKEVLHSQDMPQLGKRLKKTCKILRLWMVLLVSEVV